MNKTQNKKKEYRFTFRGTQEIQEKIDEIMRIRGLDKSGAICCCIKNAKIIALGNVSDLAKEMYQIRIALESGSDNELIREEVDQLCLSISDALQKVEQPVR